MRTAMEEIYSSLVQKRISKKEALEKIRAIKGADALAHLEQSLTELFEYNEPYVRDHVVRGKRVILGVTHCSMAIELMKRKNPEAKQFRVSDLTLVKAISIDEHQKTEVRLTLENNGEFSSTINSEISGANSALKGNVYAYGKIDVCDDCSHDVNMIDMASFFDKKSGINGPKYYTSHSEFYYGEALHTVKEFFLKDDEVLGRLDVDEKIKDRFNQYLVNPAILDAAMVSGLFHVYSSENRADEENLYIPLHIRSISVLKKNVNARWCRARLLKSNDEIIILDASLCDDYGNIIIDIKGFTCKKVAPGIDLAHHPTVTRNGNINTQSSIVNTSLQTGAKPLRQVVIQYLQAEIKQMLNTNKQIDPAVNFLESGADSIGLLRLSAKIGNRLQIELYPTVFFEYPNINEFSKFLCEENGDALRLYFKNQLARKMSSPGERKAEKEEQNAASGEMPETDERRKGHPIVSGNNVLSDRAQRNAAMNENDKDIAIVGMSGIFPGSDNVDEFWKNLSTKQNLISEIPNNHFDFHSYYSENEDEPGKIYCKWGGFIENIDKFDSDFFRVSPREAKLMDPQLRLLLQVLYACCEDAGQAKTIRGSNTGLYVGACFSDYSLQIDKMVAPVNPYQGTGNALSMMANRPSFYFDLKGPSLTVDTACSSSLIALHTACKAILSGECDQALVAGVNAVLSPWHYQYFCSIGALSRTGRCYTFDDRADGYVPGEAIVATLIKPLSKAIKSGDNIHGVVKGSAINHGGYTPSVTAPSVNQEAEVIKKAWHDAGIDARNISYIEAHGTGTKLGDPVEINAILKAFEEEGVKDGNCVVGSAKAHVGHTEGAAGLVGVVKVLLSMKNKQLPAMPGFKKLNPYIKLDGTFLSINEQTIEWCPNDARPRLAGVSSFGFGGAYAHVVVGEYPQDAMVNIANKEQIIVLSANTEDVLRQHVKQIQHYLRETEVPGLAEVAYTLQVGRDEMNCRLAFIAHDRTALLSGMDSYFDQGPDNLRCFYAQLEEEPPISSATLPLTFDSFNQSIDYLVDIAKKWVNGQVIQWSNGWKGEKPKIVSLPTYPFKQVSHWIDTPLASGANKPVIADRLHPLIDSNCSDVSTLRFNKQLSGQEFFLADHLVNTVPVLPAVVYLEMARAAGELATHSKIIQLRDIFWLLPVRLDSENNPMAVTIDFSFIDDKLNYEIFTQIDADFCLHSQGTLISDKDIINRGSSEKRNIQKLKSQFATTIDSLEFYRDIVPDAIEYGASFRSVKSISFDQNSALAELELPGGNTELLTGGFVLSPSILDGAFQACYAIAGKRKSIMLPFSLKSIDIYGEIPPSVYVYAESHNPNNNDNSSPAFDIVLIDESGETIAEFRGLVVREFKPDKNKTATLIKKNGDALEIPQDDDNETLDRNVSVEMETNKLQGPEDLSKEHSAHVVEGDASMSRRELQLGYFTRVLADKLGQAVESISPKTSFEQLGVDSITIVDLTRILEKEFGKIPKTLFFQCQNIDEITEYFSKKYPERLSEILGYEKHEIAAASPMRPLTEADEDKNKADFIKKVEDATIRIHTDKKTRIKVQTTRKTYPVRDQQDIAIVGLSGQYPNSENLQQFWQNLIAAQDCISEIPKERWNHERLFDTNRGAAGKTYSKWGGFIANYDCFDPLFFNISPKEAELIDPQERLFLQTAWSAIEDAGYTKQALLDTTNNGAVGVYVGVMYADYQIHGAQLSERQQPIALSSTPSSIANRVSFYCDFKGPSITLDSMCSSSLSAIELACQSLNNGTCEAAIAGGVNLILHPNRYLMLAQGQFLSSKGRCESFGEGGDGYVPSEGVGCVLLKTLEKAEGDNDHIYGVIKASAIGHGGRANGFTVPNPKEQGALIKKVVTQAGIEARTISYVEAHGTGTALGDPIEITALETAYGSNIDAVNVIPIGSVKSNIGHCESAAGIAGLTKILLQIKHRCIAPSLHSKTLNNNIDFNMTKFQVPQKAQEWEQLVHNDIAIPRRAALSSFGAGGSNAHLIIEEYQTAQTQTNDSPRRSELVVLSARTESALKEYAKKLINYLSAHDTPTRLVDMAYTLHIGREPLSYRVAVIVDTVDQLVSKLNSIAAGDKDMEGCYFGTEKDSSIKNEAFTYDDEDVRDLVARWASKGKLAKIADIWSSGMDVNWEILYKNTNAKRISLPTYPFGKRKYWYHGDIDLIPGKPDANSLSYHQSLSPLLDANISNLHIQAYSKRLTLNDYFIKDHRLNGQAILPAAAYVEMARSAAELASGERVTEIKNVMWLSPLPVTEGNAVSKVNITLKPKSEGLIFQVFSGEIDSTSTTVQTLHSQGNVSYSKSVHEPSEKIDLNEISSRCHNIFSGEQCYEHFNSLGLDYGPTFQTIRSLRYNQVEVLSKLEFSGGDKGNYGIRPCLFDGAFQSCLGLLLDENLRAACVPFSVAKVEIFAPIAETSYAYVRSAGQVQAGRNKTHSFDIVVCDATGNICVAVHRLLLREIANSLHNASITLPPEEHRKAGIARDQFEEISENALLLSTAWREIKIRRTREREIVGAHEPLYVFLSDDLAGLSSRFNCEQLKSDESPEKKMELQFLQVLDTIKKLENGKKCQLLIIVSDREPYYYHAPLAGLLKTACLENPDLNARLIQLPTREFVSEESLDAIIDNELADEEKHHREIRYNSKYIRQAKILIEEHDFVMPENILPIKRDGVYWITGGLGGIGQHIVKKLSLIDNVKIILSGRSRLTEEKQLILARLKKENADVIYYTGDISKLNDVEKIAQKIFHSFGKLDGIIHSAGVVRDAAVSRKMPEQIRDVFAAKINGVLNLHRMLSARSIDFMVLFSSIAGVAGNPGQCDYAGANAFMDEFAKFRQSLVDEGICFGKTISIAWPLWREGGMGIAEPIQIMMEKRTGMKPLETRIGMVAFELSLRSHLSQVVIVPGNKEKLKQYLHISPQTEESAATADHEPGSIKANAIESKSAIDADDIEMKLKLIMQKVLKVDVEDINADTDYADYGLDSISMMSVLNELENTFGESFPANTLIDYRNIEDLAVYIAQSCAYPDQKSPAIDLQEISGNTPGRENEKQNPNSIASNVNALTDGKRRGGTRFIKLDSHKTEYKSGSVANKKIAVIGAACRFPGSKTPDEFWNNLCEGRNLIGKVPEERWNISKYLNQDMADSIDATYSDWAGIIDGLEYFDPEFFGIAENDAIAMDPQQRVILELAQETLDAAGYCGQEVKGSRTAVYIGARDSGYLNTYRHLLDKRQASHMLVDNLVNMIPARISDFYDFNAPSCVIDTACSSSLVAIHQACRSLLNKECDMALAGGVSFLLDERCHVGFSQSGVLAKGNKSYIFDERAEGFVLGEGAGMVLLKDYDAAVADNDNIQAVILASAVNNDGKTTGLTVPNQTGQQSVITQAIEASGVCPSTITYLEAHGTGTLLGDPIEIKAASNAYSKYTDKKAYCATGSVKSNVGHMLSAAGIGSFIKVILSLKNKTIPPTLNCEHEHPRFRFEDTPFYPCKNTQPWGTVDGYRRAGISSFGFGGTNCHLIVEEFISNHSDNNAKRRQPLPPTIFNKKPLWLGRTPDNGEEQFAMYKSIIKRLKSDSLSVDDAIRYFQTSQVPLPSPEQRVHL